MSIIAPKPATSFKMTCLVSLCLIITIIFWPSSSGQSEARTLLVNQDANDAMFSNFKEYLIRRLMKDYSTSNGDVKVNGPVESAISQHLDRRNIKRSCKIDAGMAYNCDFKQLLSAVNARRYLESSMSPGRRKRMAVISRLAMDGSRRGQLPDEALLLSASYPGDEGDPESMSSP